MPGLASSIKAFVVDGIMIVKFFLLDISGLNALFRFLNRNRALILMYHGICDDNFALSREYGERHTPKSLFKRQIVYLKRKGYTFINMSELVDVLKGKKYVRKPVVLTFDDGLRNVIKNAYPLMKELRAKGCFYLVSGLIGKSELLWTDRIETAIRGSKEDKFQFIFRTKTFYYDLRTSRRRQEAIRDILKKLKTLSNEERIEHLRQFGERKPENVPEEFVIADWDEIKKLDPSILEIGSHTRTHPYCTALTSQEEYRDEIKNSKADIEKMLGYRISHFNYPAGMYSDSVAAYVKGCGYKTAVTTRLGLNGRSADLFRLKRIGAPRNFLFFKAVTSGAYSFFAGLDRRP